jgi:DNA-binding HxlR family transcriptional regulator/putative sterol carrier protein
VATAKRTYGDACGIARALDTVGERWALLIVRELLLGPKRFTDIRSGLPSLSADVLAARLRELEASGVVARRVLPPPAASQVYELTPAGRALEQVVIELGRWGGANLPRSPEGTGMSLDAAVLSFPTLFDPALAGNFEATIALRLGPERFVARVAGGRFGVERGETAAPDATIAADPRTLLDVAHGRRKLEDALESGDLEISGDAKAGKRFMGLFPIPAAAAQAPGSGS